jgi:gluconolactonase
MFIGLASRIRLLSCFVPVACSVAFLACGSATIGGGTGGQGATGTGGGSGGSHTGGATGTGGSGTGGVTGSGGNGTGGNGTGGNGTGGSGTGGAATGGTIGSGGQAGGGAGSGGAAGSTTSGFTPYVCPIGISSPTSFPAGSTATQIAGGPPSDSFNNNGNNYETIEGPVWITNALYVSEFGTSEPPPSRILKIDESDNVTIAFPSISDTGSNGLAVDKNGNIVSANHGIGGIVKFTLPTGMPTNTLIDVFAGKRFNSPNDLTIRGDGTVYFTDPAGYQGQLVQANQGVYMLPSGSSTAMELISTLNSPNGITLSLDGNTLYVDDNGDGVMKYPVNGGGTIGTGAPFDTDLAHTACDGMTIDCAGDLYVVRSDEHHIIVVNPSGTTIGDISGFPNSALITNVAFGGADHQWLYITAQGTGSQRGVFKMHLSVPGMPY